MLPGDGGPPLLVQQQVQQRTSRASSTQSQRSSGNSSSVAEEVERGAGGELTGRSPVLAAGAALGGATPGAPVFSVVADNRGGGGGGSPYRPSVASLPPISPQQQQQRGMWLQQQQQPLGPLQGQLGHPGEFNRPAISSAPAASPIPAPAAAAPVQSVTRQSSGSEGGPPAPVYRGGGTDVVASPTSSPPALGAAAHAGGSPSFTQAQAYHQQQQVQVQQAQSSTRPAWGERGVGHGHSLSFSPSPETSSRRAALIPDLLPSSPRLGVASPRQPQQQQQAAQTTQTTHQSQWGQVATSASRWDDDGDVGSAALVPAVRDDRVVAFGAAPALAAALSPAPIASHNRHHQRSASHATAFGATSLGLLLPSPSSRLLGQAQNTTLLRSVTVPSASDALPAPQSPSRRSPAYVGVAAAAAAAAAAVLASTTSSSSSVSGLAGIMLPTVTSPPSGVSPYGSSDNASAPRLIASSRQPPYQQLLRLLSPRLDGAGGLVLRDDAVRTAGVKSSSSSSDAGLSIVSTAGESPHNFSLTPTSTSVPMQQQVQAGVLNTEAAAADIRARSGVVVEVAGGPPFARSPPLLMGGTPELLPRAAGGTPVRWNSSSSSSMGGGGPHAPVSRTLLLPLLSPPSARAAVSPVPSSPSRSLVMAIPLPLSSNEATAGESGRFSPQVAAWLAGGGGGEGGGGTTTAPSTPSSVATPPQ